MSEDLQHIDEFFHNTVGPYEESPSPASWENLQARLDKEYATTYKRRFIAARRVSIILLLLLITFVICETRLNKLSPRGTNEEIGAKINVTNKPNKMSPTENLSNKISDIKSNSSKMQQHFLKTDNGTHSSKEVFEKWKLASNHFLKEIDNTKHRGEGQINRVSLPKAKGKLSDAGLNLQANIAEGKYYSNEHGTFYLGDKKTFERKNKPDHNKSDLNVSISENTNDLLFSPRSPFVIQPYITKTYNNNLNSLPYNNKTSIAKSILSDSILQNIPKSLKKVTGTNTSFKPYWTLTTIASPEWTQYSLENGVPDNGNSQLDEKSQIQQREKHELSFSVWVMASYQFKRHWAIQTGLLYSNSAIAIDTQKIYAAKEANGEIAYKYNSSSGYAFLKPDFGLPPTIGDSLIAASAQHNLQYFSIPIILKYKFEKKGFTFSPGLGLSANFLTSAKIKTEVKDALNRETVTISKLEGTRLFYFGLIANADIQFNFYKKWALNVTPAFRLAVTPITKNNVVKTFPYGFGVGIGLNYRF
ncbi:MAG: PorT family protein [Bacteroidetes bacterium]|nr:PorT family protein [Bacteroidota bacterium]